MRGEPAARSRWLLGVFLLAAALAGCSPPRWTVLSQSLDRVVLSVWSPAPGEACVAGGGQGNGRPGLLLHLFDGRWAPIDLNTTDTLWWVHGLSATEVFAVGENGAIFHFDGTRATRMASGTRATLFGVWGSASDDVWAVGGTPGGSGDEDVLLHFDGTAWSAVRPPQLLGATYFKVWGSGKNDVFVVGEGGLILHFDGTVWTRQHSPVGSTLRTVAGRSATDVYAVGGPPTAFVHYDGTRWSSLTPPQVASGLGGVSADGNGGLMVVGLGGVKWRSDSSGALLDETDQEPHQDLHSAWVGADGSGFAVGGDFLVAGTPGAAKRGVVAYFGASPPPPIP